MKKGFKKFKNAYRADGLKVGDIVVLNEGDDAHEFKVTGEITTISCEVTQQPYGKYVNQYIDRGMISGIKK